MKKIFALVLALALALCLTALSEAAESVVAESEAVESETVESVATESEAAEPEAAESEATESIEPVFVSPDFVATFDWSEAEAALNEMDGEFHTFSQVGFKLWIPDSMNSVELEQEYIDAGIVALFLANSETAAIAIQCTKFESSTLEEYATLLEEAGALLVLPADVNGKEALTYVLEENNSANIAMLTQSGDLVEFIFMPASEEENDTFMRYIFDSIQAI